MTIKDYLLNYLRGIAMGAADIVPGVSGGTIALITGIYPRLIRGIDEAMINGMDALKHTSQFAFSKVRMVINRIDFPLFIPLLLGIATSFLSLSHVIHYLLVHEVDIVFSFFFGLILASCIFIIRGISVFNVATITAFFLGSAFSFLFVGINPLEANHTGFIIFLSGTLAICAMLLPGISGSFILVFLGQYEYMLSAINEVRIVTIILFMAGAVVGLAVFSRLIDYMMTHFRPVAFACITGLMAGSLRLPYMKIVSVDYSWPSVIGFGITGLAVVFVLEFVFSRNKE